MRKELKEAFRFYDKEGNARLHKNNFYLYYCKATAFRFYDKEGNTILRKINYYQYYYNKEAFRFYDKEGNTILRKINYYQYYYNATAFRFYDKEGNIIFFVKANSFGFSVTRHLSDFTTKKVLLLCVKQFIIGIIVQKKNP
jgi:Ca2+-binding EF-hand superfamily protein